MIWAARRHLHIAPMLTSEDEALGRWMSRLSREIHTDVCHKVRRLMASWTPRLTKERVNKATQSASDRDGADIHSVSIQKLYC
ncbi:hypothetical protein Hamer_G029925 [Homarus americanus]|uniref:Uncharacterized protein n=1 Tax=Homarus americanus TaxID=6706 RepID=A0A8J5N9K2_HOMAM|nr:hypothetical protein Hamer_G029925 [Homarus americanus]